MAMSIERKNSFHLLLSDDELKLLRLLAEREGLNASEYLRSLLRQMAGTSPHLAHAIRLGAALGGKIDLLQLVESHATPTRASAKKAK
jgi:hypothetical protein